LRTWPRTARTPTRIDSLPVKEEVDAPHGRLNNALLDLVDASTHEHRAAHIEGHVLTEVEL
jgi:hypothetical protein